MASWTLVNIGSNEGLMSVGTKPLSEPVLTYHKSGPAPEGDRTGFAD